jgi:hypothetical protein
MPANKERSPAAKAWIALGVEILVAAVVAGFIVLQIFGDTVFRSSLVAVKADAIGSSDYGD